METNLIYKTKCENIHLWIKRNTRTQTRQEEIK